MSANTDAAGPRQLNVGCVRLPVRVLWQGERLLTVRLAEAAPADDPAPPWVADLAERFAAWWRGEDVAWPVERLAPPPTDFQRRVRETVMAIPRGRTLSYGEVAARAGSPKAARAIGNAMAANDYPLIIPCHRVVAANGLGGFGCGVHIKRLLLALETP